MYWVSVKLKGELGSVADTDWFRYSSSASAVKGVPEATVSFATLSQKHLQRFGASAHV